MSENLRLLADYIRALDSCDMVTVYRIRKQMRAIIEANNRAIEGGQQEANADCCQSGNDNCGCSNTANTEGYQVRWQKESS